METKDILERIDQISDGIKTAIREHEEEIESITEMVDSLLAGVQKLGEGLSDLSNTLAGEVTKIVNKDKEQ